MSLPGLLGSFAMLSTSQAPSLFLCLHQWHVAFILLFTGRLLNFQASQLPSGSKRGERKDGKVSAECQWSLSLQLTSHWPGWGHMSTLPARESGEMFIFNWAYYHPIKYWGSVRKRGE